MKNRSKVPNRRSKSISRRTKAASGRQSLSLQNTAANTSTPSTPAPNPPEPPAEAPLAGVAGIDIGDQRCHLRLIDFDGGASLNGGTPLTAPDPHCPVAHRDAERKGSCGLGFELALLLPPLLALRRRRERARRAGRLSGGPQPG